MADLHVRGYFAEAIAGSKPVKFRGRIIPEYFKCIFYIIDNDGIKVSEKNAKNFKTWTLELTLRTTSSETVEPVAMSVSGAKKYIGAVTSFKRANPLEQLAEAGTLPARYFNLIHSNRAKLISYSATQCLQTVRYKKTKDGGHSWTIGDYIDISESELQETAKSIVNSAYTKLDGTFYQEFADRYRAQVLAGDRTPIKTLQELYYKEKSIKHVQSYATEARKRGLLPKAEKGKNSPVRKTRKAGKK